LELPKVSKEIENWSGKFQVTELNLKLADTDGSVSGSLGTAPFGTKVGMMVKVAENPPMWQFAYTGNITKVERQKGITSVNLQDNFKNLLNSKFVSDYGGLATFVTGVEVRHRISWWGGSYEFIVPAQDYLLGTVVDVIGANVYMNDYGVIRLIKRTVSGEGGDWFSPAVSGAAIGANFGVPGAIVGGFLGFMGGLFGGGDEDRETYYYRVSDYNLIPDGAVLGGQTLKFYPGTINSVATNTRGILYDVPAQKITSGTFVNGISGTLQLHNALHNVNIGDYIYAEVPLLYSGSPDDIIVDMLTGSNCSVPFKFPEDFSAEWFNQSNVLRHIWAHALVKDFEIGGVANAVDSLAKEFGFSFYLDEAGKFAIKTIRAQSILSADIIGTIREGYNIIGDGAKSIEDIHTAYTDLTYKFKNGRLGGFEQTIEREFPAATFFGAQRRTLNIDSQWVHDKITGEFMATRLSRRNTNIIPQLECDVSLYSVPMRLGMKKTSRIAWEGLNLMMPTIGIKKEPSLSLELLELLGILRLGALGLL
jgi:hypothetical protein